MDYSILNKLTILIPTYNRGKYLKQTIKYWSDYNELIVRWSIKNLRIIA